MIDLSARPIDAAALAPFARVLDGPHGTLVPEVLEPGTVPGAPALTLLHPTASAEPPVITFLERHPHSAQTFLPLSVGRWLVAVAPTGTDGLPDLGGLLAFHAGPGDAICIARDVWHAPLTVLDRPARFAMLMWKSATGTDGVVHRLPGPLRLSLTG